MSVWGHLKAHGHRLHLSLQAAFEIFNPKEAIFV